MSAGITSQTKSVDMDKIVKSMTMGLDSYWSTYDSGNGTNSCSIRKVPQHIREVDGNAYEPIVLSIGPYHHGSHSLREMEREKWKCLHYILRLDCKITLQDYIRTIFNLEKQARSSYHEDIKMDKKRFVQMLLLDACFILVKVDGTVISGMQSVGPHSASTSGQIVKECVDKMTITSHEAVNRQSIEHESAVAKNLLHGIELTVHGKHMERHNDHNKYGHHDQYPHDQNTVGDWHANFVWHDLFLLENQMPFFVTETVYEFAVRKGITNAPPLREKMCECVQDILRHFPHGIQDSDRLMNFHHMLHLCHMYFRPTEKFVNSHGYQSKVRYFHHLIHWGQTYFCVGRNTEETEQQLLPIQQKNFLQAGQLPSRWRQAVQYHEAGVQLKRREYSSYSQHSLLDVRFKNGIIEVPFLPIDENTESLFKNLIAFEQTDSQFGNDVTAYIAFMSQLLSTPADATLLAERGIIVHMLDSDDEVSALFVRLTKDISFDFGSGYYLQYLCRILEAHYQNRLNRWMAWLWQKHFSNPWLALAVLAGVIVLFCTIVQTLFTVLAYVKPTG